MTALRLYLETWVIPNIRDAVAISNGEKTVADVKFTRYTDGV